MGISVDQEGPLVVTLGERMLRLKSPGNERLFQSPTLEATFAGGEANVAVSLASGLSEAAPEADARRSSRSTARRASPSRPAQHAVPDG